MSKAVGASLLATPDGLPTVKAVQRNRQYRAARDRLGELPGALTAVVIEARHDLYLAAFESWKRRIPGPMVRRFMPRPADVERVERAVLFGVPVLDGFRAALAPAVLSLRSTLAVAASPRTTRAVAARSMARWADRAEAGMVRAARAAIVSSLTLADSEALGDVLGERQESI